MSTLLDDNTINVPPVSGSSNYIPNHKKEDSSPDEMSSAIAYFLEVFANEFEQATIALQQGEISITEAFGTLLQTISDEKNTQLDKDNSSIQTAINEENKYIDGGGKDQNKIAEYNNNITIAEQQYKSDDSEYQQEMQILNSANQGNINLDTAISQNNASIYQLATYIVGIMSMFQQIYNK